MRNRPLNVSLDRRNAGRSLSSSGSIRGYAHFPPQIAVMPAWMGRGIHDGSRKKCAIGLMRFAGNDIAGERVAR